MSASNFRELLSHVGHRVIVTPYGPLGYHPINVSIECLTCNEVLVSFDREEDCENE